MKAHKTYENSFMKPSHSVTQSWSMKKCFPSLLSHNHGFAKQVQYKTKNENKFQATFFSLSVLSSTSNISEKQSEIHIKLVTTLFQEAFTHFQHKAEVCKKYFTHLSDTQPWFCKTSAVWDGILKQLSGDNFFSLPSHFNIEYLRETIMNAHKTCQSSFSKSRHTDSTHSWSLQ